MWQMQTQDSSSYVKNPDTEPSLEEVDGSTIKRDVLLKRNLEKQDVKRAAALKVVRAKAERVRFAANLEQNPFVKGQGSGVAPPIDQAPRRGCGYDPFAPVDRKKTRKLLDMLSEEEEYPKRPKGSVNYWYWTLRCNKQWLTDLHMDAAMTMLRGRLLKNPDHFRTPRICFADSMMPRVWRSAYEDFKNSEPNHLGAGKLLPASAWDLYMGKDPELNRTDKIWMEEVDDVYMPLHITDDHWVACWISLTQKHITIYDSIIRHSTIHQIDAAIEPVAVMLPHLLFDLAREEKYRGTLEKFTHHRQTFGVPQNVVAGDCGVFSIKFIECHALGVAFSERQLCDDNMKDLRAKLAAEIWDETELRGKEDGKVWEKLDLYGQS